jgi:type III pantothenate kinase
MNLALDIGNTLTKAAWFEKGKLIENFRASNSEIADIIDIANKRAIEMAIVSSVGKTDPEPVLQSLKGVKLAIVLNHQTPLPLKILYNTPHTLGYDRIAAAAGAQQLCPGKNVLIIDMGTAITIDFISADGEYKGGNISPGMLTRFKALHAYTEKLPLVSEDPLYPEFGSSTHSAIAAGVQQGIIYEINGYWYEFSRKYPGCEFIIAGGDADFFVSKLKSTIFAVPELVLIGLNAILEHNTKEKND